MHFPVAVTQVYVDRFTFKPTQFLGSGAGKLKVRNVDVRLHRWVRHIIDEANHALDVVQRRMA